MAPTSRRGHFVRPEAIENGGRARDQPRRTAGTSGRIAMAGDCGTVVDLVEERALEGDGDEKIESRVSKRRCVGTAEPGSGRRPAEIKVSATLIALT
jgi:hypothetical protein